MGTVSNGVYTREEVVGLSVPAVLSSAVFQCNIFVHACVLCNPFGIDNLKVDTVVFVDISMQTTMSKSPRAILVILNKSSQC